MEELKSAAPKTDSQISTTDEYIPLQDTDGNLVKINPASFQEAVRNVLGGLLANNDKGVTISGIPALSGSGASLDFGSVTPANLASVLGVRKPISSGENVDNFLAEGHYYWLNGWPSGRPSASYNAVMDVKKIPGEDFIIQVVYDYDGFIFTRWHHNNAWGSWSKLTPTTITT